MGKFRLKVAQDLVAQIGFMAAITRIASPNSEPLTGGGRQLVTRYGLLG
ncbi:unnamed protein product [Protopolystoma xenopodis]|uniref:Uncharacterized protein n=1 Tax=Protopolystoma xenopodis TaxID=117903 RepID=A0A448WU73_9PLAT|nr:unnamed protein product [Protopolystoma xenopodis]